MPLTAAALGVLALVIVPGALGTYLWDQFNGQDRHRTDWQAAIRYVGFSALGLCLYVLLATAFPVLPAAVHVLPDTYSAWTLQQNGLGHVALAYLGHIVCAGVVGFAAAWLHRGICKITKKTPHPSAWDHFIKRSFAGRWIVVTLKSGDVFAGYVEVAEESAPPAERDVVLKAPALRDPSGRYLGTGYYDMFLPADLIQNIATQRRLEEISEFPKVNEPLFKESANGETIGAATAESAVAVPESITG